MRHTSRALIWTSCCIPHSAEALAVASKVLSLGIGSSVPESSSVLGTTEIIGGFESFEFVGKFIMAYQSKTKQQSKREPKKGMQLPSNSIIQASEKI